MRQLFFGPLICICVLYLCIFLLKPLVELKYYAANIFLAQVFVFVFYLCVHSNLNLKYFAATDILPRHIFDSPWFVR